ncbi:MAG: DUF4367 domain-containing protein [Alistipes sp.]|nr:DUF4367 domain-containing protein [Alistipes sp.]
MTIDLGKQEQTVISLPTSENDPYGIKAKCAEYGISPQAPFYLPDGFELVDFYAEINEAFSDICFFYKNGKTRLNITFTKYVNSDNIPPIGIPTDTYNLQETEINGQTVFILKEDGQFTATYLNNGIVYVITSNKLDYDECQKVVEAMK